MMIDRRLLTSLCWWLVIVVGCSAPPPPAGQLVRDATGQTLTVPIPAQRVMAFSPALTEMLFAVCDTAQVVAVTPHCNFPAAAKRKPQVGTYPLDFEAILQHRPDVVFTEEGITSPADAQRLAELGVPVYRFAYQQVTDIFDALDTLGRLTGREAVARRLTDSLRTEAARLAQTRPAQPWPKVLAITWPEPIYVYGQNTVFTDKLRLVGARNAVVDTFAQPYPALTTEYILKLAPDVLLGGSVARFDSTLLAQHPALRRLEAYQQRRVYDPTDDLMSRPGPRVLESVRELRRFIYADSSLVPGSPNG